MFLSWSLQGGAIHDVTSWPTFHRSWLRTPEGLSFSSNVSSETSMLSTHHSISTETVARSIASWMSGWQENVTSVELSLTWWLKTTLSNLAVTKIDNQLLSTNFNSMSQRNIMGGKIWSCLATGWFVRYLPMEVVELVSTITQDLLRLCQPKTALKMRAPSSHLHLNILSFLKVYWLFYWVLQG